VISPLREHSGIGLLHGLEAAGGGKRSLVVVGVVKANLLAVGSPQLGVGDVRVNAEDLIRVRRVRHHDKA
jgi:hypothetical protein